MKTIRFDYRTDRHPGYYCSEPGDQSGEYVPAEVAQRQEATIEELWHNLFRMHSYIEAEMATLAGDRPGILKNADAILTASWARVQSVLSDLRTLEPLPRCCQPKERD